MEFEQDCVDGSCRCKEGLRGVEDGRDRNAAYPAITQCRNNSYNLGMIFLCSKKDRTVGELSIS